MFRGLLPHKATPENQTDTIFIKSPASGNSEKYGFIEILLGVCKGSIGDLHHNSETTTKYDLIES